MKSTYKKLKTKLVILLFIISLSLVGCKKFIDIDAPVTNTNAANAYSSDPTAAAVLTGIYTRMSNTSFSNGAITGLSLYLGLSADELTLFSGSKNTTHIQYYRNALIANNSNTSYTDFWYNLYQYIFVANSALEGLSNSSTLTSAVKQQLLGEAKFIRAFCYFYLVNLYADVPLAIGTDYTVNAVLSRSPKAKVWQQIIADLKDAKELLSSNYLNGSLQTYAGEQERVRPTNWAATALLARAYLYIGDYVNAEAQATAVINNSSIYSLTTLNNAFLKNNTEAIWQLQPVLSGYNTQDARLFIIPSTGPSNGFPVYLSDNILNSFDSGDLRKTNWTKKVSVGSISYYYSYKYKVSSPNSPVTEYLTVLRLSEQYLIRAESRAKQENISGASSDLDAIRTRAGLLSTTANTQSALLSAIQHERQVELFTEWGHRWLDLKRTNTVDAVMSIATPQKGGTWNVNWQLYPIVLSELQRNSNLIQNPGY